MFEKLAAVFIFEVPFILRWVNDSLSVYVRDSWMNKEQSINHIKFQFSDRTFCNIAFSNYVTLQ